MGNGKEESGERRGQIGCDGTIKLAVNRIEQMIIIGSKSYKYASNYVSSLLPMWSYVNSRQ
jgi:hypothetical protein